MEKPNKKLQNMVIEIAFDSKDYRKHPSKCVYYALRDESGVIHNENDFTNVTRKQLLTAQASLKAVTSVIDKEIQDQDDRVFVAHVKEEVEVLTALPQLRTRGGLSCYQKRATKANK